MRRCGAVYSFAVLIYVLLGLAAPVHASIFGTVRGLVHDGQHRPIKDAAVTLRSATSDWTQSATSDDAGTFQFNSVPLGEYTLSVDAAGFASQTQKLTVTSGTVAEPHFPMAVAAVEQKVEVSAEGEQVDTTSATPQTLIGRDTIARTPGADNPNSMAMITDYVPGAVIVHNQLHVRGGHQVEWRIDGVAVPNTNIASNVGPQFDPKDVDYLEAQRGGFTADYGDRAYGVFNVETRSGFERERTAELALSYGSFNQTNDQLNFGSHTDRFAYYGSVSANRTDLGLETPQPDVVHDQAAGLSGFTSLIFNVTPTDQMRFVGSARGDHYQVPNTDDAQAAGIRDVEDERDVFTNFSWLHTSPGGIVLTVSPFYHFNRAHYLGAETDTPFIPEEDRGSNYAGANISLAVIKGRHNARIGVEGFAQRDNQFFRLTSTDGSGDDFRQRQRATGGVATIFLEDQFRATSWLTLTGGVRLTHFNGEVNENSADPRVGAAIRVPRLGWVLRGFYGRYYQPPPLLTVSGPIEDLAAHLGFGFLPLHGERDEQYDVGISIPFRGWTLESDYFRTGARNFFDHDALGESNIFFPLTLARARIRGAEVAVNSPRLWGRLRSHLAYSRQTIQGFGSVSGGLTDFSPPANELFFLDHDQRHTLSIGGDITLPGRAWLSTNVNYGSGFLDGDGPGHLPAHTTVDFALGKGFGENWTGGLTALNVGNRHYLIDAANTFGGTHWANPREVSLQLRYRFHY
jgi:hypothetical protein